MVAKLVKYFNVNEYGRTVQYGLFSYRDREYMVRYAGWNAASDEEPAMQHKREQRRIDELLDQQKPDETTKYEDTVEYAMELFMQDWGD